MATVNSNAQIRNFETITSNNYVPEHPILQTAQPQKHNDYGFLWDIPYPLSVSAGTYQPNTLGEYPSDSIPRNVFVTDARPIQKFFYNTVRQSASGKAVEPYTNPNYTFERKFSRANI